MKLAKTARNLALSGLVLTGACNPNTNDGGVNETVVTADLQADLETRNFADERKKFALKACDFNGDGSPEPGKKRSRGTTIICADLNEDGRIDIVSSSGAGKDWCTSLPEGIRLDPRKEECDKADNWIFVPENSEE